MFRRTALVISLVISVVLVLSVLVLVYHGRVRDVPLDELLVDPALPPIYHPALDSDTAVNVDWQLLVGARTTSHVCGPLAAERMRRWNDTGRPADQPLAHIYACATISPWLTSALFDATGPRESLSSLVAEPPAVDDARIHDLHAHQAKVWCASGDTETLLCQAWVLHARYGQYLIVFHWEDSEDDAGSLTFDEFLATAASIDAAVADVLMLSE